jgi:hypothetical protein
MREFHYLRMTRDYLAEYEKEIARNNSSHWPSADSNGNLSTTSAAPEA